MMRPNRHCLPGLLIALVLAGCASTPPVTPFPEQNPADNRPASNIGTSTPPPVVMQTKPGKGAYYQDDGPGDKVPPGLTQIPDAIPRVETYSRTANRPYNVFGIDFVPDTSDKPFKQQGIGSWYGRKFHGQKTASGEIYDMYAMTAAHPTLPIPSYAKVTNVGTGQSVIVRVNDRGPFLRSRVMDLSYAAALKLGYVDLGSTLIEVERLLPNDIIAGKFRANPWTAQIAAGMPATDSVKASIPATPVAIAAPAAHGNVALDSVQLPGLPDEARLTALIATASAPTNDTVDPTTPNIPADAAALPPATGANEIAAAAMTPIAVGGKGFYLQLAAFRVRNIADEFKQKVALELDAGLVPRLVVKAVSLAGTEWFRVQLGPYASRTQADAAAQSLRSNVGNSYRPIVVSQP